MIRKSVFAGAFYSGNQSLLKKTVSGFLGHAAVMQGTITIAPHAGYIYSGACAGKSFASIMERIRRKNSTVVLVGPNHTGLGMNVAVSSADWETPIGISKTDNMLVERMLKSNRSLSADETAHSREHSLEVMLPFIQEINPEARIVCVCMGSQGFATANSVAETIFGSVKDWKNVSVVCSSDFTHFQSAETARQLDTEAIGRILDCDAGAFSKLVETKNLSICGYGPITTGIILAGKLGLANPVLNMYTNSGYASGDFENVVAYASITF